MEGKLYAAPDTSHYLIGDAEGPALMSGQAIKVFLGGYWISDQVASENEEGDHSPT